MRSLVLAGVVLVASCGGSSNEGASPDAAVVTPDASDGSDTVLSKTVVFGPGGPLAMCPYGGYDVETGIDTNHDGILEDDEVTSRDLICNPKPTSTLVSTSAEPPGAHCPGGGTVVMAGVDTNDDGILEPGEVQTTTYVCFPNFIQGNVTIHTAADLAQLDGIAVITGNLTVDSVTVTSLALPDLQSIGGNFTCGGVLACPLTTLSLPALTTVGNLAVSGSQFVELDVPVLASAENISVSGASVSALAFPSLFTVTSLQLSSSASLTMLSLPVLDTGALSLSSTGVSQVQLPAWQQGALTITSNRFLTTVSAPALVQSDGIYLNSSPLTSFDVPALVSTAQLTVEATAMTTLSLPMLTTITGALELESNQELHTVSAPLLVTLGGPIEIIGNPSYPTCAVTALWAQLDYPPGTISDNGSGSCP